jgi:hypothetical protein
MYEEKSITIGWNALYRQSPEKSLSINIKYSLTYVIRSVHHSLEESAKVFPIYPSK